MKRNCHLFSLQELKQFKKSNDLSGYHYWHQGMSDWEIFEGSKLQKQITKKYNYVVISITLVVLLFMCIWLYFLLESSSDKKSSIITDNGLVTEVAKETTTLKHKDELKESIEPLNEKTAISSNENNQAPPKYLQPPIKIGLIISDLYEFSLNS